MSHSVLLIGDSGTGKTVYGAQLLGRLQFNNTGVLRRRVAIESLAAFESPLQELAKGKLPSHTSAGTYHETTLELVDSYEREIIIKWPDYAGEQMPRIIEQRSLSAQWRTNLLGSDAWLVFLRLSHMPIPDDALDRRVMLTDEPAEENIETVTLPLSPQAATIELLQILRHLYQENHKHRRIPQLGVILTVYDELAVDDGLVPAEELARREPLLFDYLETNWPESLRFVVGLSALGASLDNPETSTKFRLEGPEEQGYIILPDGTSTTDLTMLIALTLPPVA
jgi:hypothetical protein